MAPRPPYLSYKKKTVPPPPPPPRVNPLDYSLRDEQSTVADDLEHIF